MSKKIAKKEKVSKSLEKDLNELRDNYNMGFISSFELLNQVISVYYEFVPDSAFRYIYKSLDSKLRGIILKSISDLMPVEIEK